MELNGTTDLKSINGIINNLLYLTPKRKLLYVTDTNNGIPSGQFQHLSCYLSGVVALGTHTLDISPKERELHLWVARGLAQTCYLTYVDQPTGLGPDSMHMNSDGKWMDHLARWESQGRPGNVPPGVAEILPQKDGDQDYTVYAPGNYLLRPEVRSFRPLSVIFS